MKKIIFSLSLLLALATVFAFTVPVNWKPGKHSIAFSTEGTSGIFKTFSGTLIFDEQNVGASKFDVSIDVNSINTGNGMMNKHAKGADWFDAAKYPSIRFVSKKFQKKGNAYMVTGTLSMHGVSKDLTIPFLFNSSGSGGKFEGSFNVSRKEFGIGDPGGEVGEIIKLVVSVPVTK